MQLTQLHWLEIAEYVAIIATLISLPIGIAASLWSLPLVSLAISLVLNLINRSRSQRVQRKRLSGNLKQVQRQLIEEVKGILTESEINRPRSSASVNNGDAQQLQENMASLQEALNNVVVYLKSQNFSERIEALETICDRLQQDIHNINALSEQITPETPVVASPALDLPDVVAPSVQSTTTPVTPSNVEWQCLHSLDAHEETVASLAIDVDRRFLVSVGWDRNLKIWDLSSGEWISPRTERAQGILAVVFLDCQGDRYRLATGGFDRKLEIWSFFPNERELSLDRVLNKHNGSIYALDFARSQKILVSGSYDCTIRQWDSDSGDTIQSSYDDSGAVYAIALHEATGIIASAGGDGRVTLWQLNSGEKLGCLVGNVSSVESLAIAPDGQTLAAGCSDGTIKLWQLESDTLSPSSARPIRVLQAGSDGVKSLIFSPALAFALPLGIASAPGQYLFSGSSDGQVKIWYPGSSDPLESFSGSQRAKPISSLALSADNRILAVGNTEGKIKIWQHH
jgi:WD40 repeat protein